MSTTPIPVPLTPPDKPWFDPKTGLPTKAFHLYMISVDTALRLICAKI